MAVGDTLTRKQRRFVRAALVCPTIEAAAELSGISERTAYRYLKADAVQDALSEAFDGALADATRRALQAMNAALDTLVAIHRDGERPAASRVQAARAILEAGPRLREAYDLAQRVSELERTIGGVL